ncbi:MAG: hypothetical protein HOP19_19565 [Acidobacteria bacterium]|nr:hypothetical protein [Acidobacteriota bacterium]
MLLLLAGGITKTFAQGPGDLPVPGTKKKAPPATAKSKTTPKPKATSPVATPTPAPVVREEPRPRTPERKPAQQPALSFNQLVQAGLDERNSGRNKVGNYYNEYIFNGKSSDLFTLQFQADNPALSLLFYDATGGELMLTKDMQSGDYKLGTAGGTLPTDGEYRVRILNASEGKLATGSYSLKLVRAGMVEAAYLATLEKTARAFKAEDPANVEATAKQLEQLAADDPKRPGAFELLGVIYQYHKPNAEKAIHNYEQAIRLGGAAQFKINYDGTGVAPKRKGELLEWRENKIAWLRLYDGRLLLADPTDASKILFSFNGVQMRSIERASSAPLITMQGLQRRNYYFAPLPSATASDEANLIVRFIQTYVIKKVK